MASYAGTTFRPPSHTARAAVTARRDWGSEDHPPQLVEEYVEGEDEEEEEEEQQFVLSVANTPAMETAPRLKTTAHRMIASEARSSSEASRSFDDLSDALLNAVSRGLGSPAVERSRPIAIEMPKTHQAKPGPSSNPSAPLSARGDLPGGYFPNHEDPDTRVLRPHPFHADVKEARRQSLAWATVESTSPTNNPDNGNSQQHPIHSTTSAPVISNGPPGTKASSLSATSAQPNAPADTTDMQAQSHLYQGSVTSYNPTGALDNMLPMGKYYPTNWENRKRQKRLLREQQQQAPDQKRSESQSPKPGTEKQEQKRPQHHQPQREHQPQQQPRPQQPSSSTRETKSMADHQSVARAKAPQVMMSHSRSDSEVKRRMQQYQRDMIAQAALAASQALGGAIQQRGSDTVMQTLNRIPTLRNLQLSPSPSPVPGPSTTAAVMTTAPATASQALHGFLQQKPVSPRLQPLGSPGPVTPIDLAANADELVYPVVGASGGGGRPRMPLGVVTAPPAGQQDSSFPF